jgi:hypothetical protein
MSSASRLLLSCPITSPETGFGEDEAFADVTAGGDSGPVRVRTCATGLFGAECSWWAYTEGSGPTRLESASLYSPYGEPISFRVEVSLPKFTTLPSSVSAYGFTHDSGYVTLSDLNSYDLSSLESQISSQGSSISSLQESVSWLDWRVGQLECAVFGCP